MTTDPNNKLENITLAPFINLSRILIKKDREVGGNAFRHMGSTLFILLDYEHMDAVLLKSAVIHDLLEDTDIDPQEIVEIDEDGPAVLELTLEVTRNPDQDKETYLKNLLKTGSRRSHLLKTADRLSNLIDTNLDVYGREKISRDLKQSEEYVLKMANKVDKRMAKELRTLIKRRRDLINMAP